MPVEPNARLQITAFDWVPDFAKGFVRDLRPRWACEEIGLDYSERLLDATNPRPENYFLEQPWGQVPVIHDGDIQMFESGAILLHLGEKDELLLPCDPRDRANTISWLFAAFNSVEPLFFELANVQIFSAGEEWAQARKPGLLAFIGQRLDRLSGALGDKDYLTGQFSIADIAMATVLRESDRTDLLDSRPALAAYLGRCTRRPAFTRALEAQFAAFRADEPVAA
jgi:glutathione S-transferase